MTKGSEDENCVVVVAQSLELLASRLNAQPQANPADGERTEGVVTVAECGQFVALMDTVVHNIDHTAARVRDLTLSVQPQLVPTLAALLRADALLRTVEQPNSAALLNQICIFFNHGVCVRVSDAATTGTSVSCAQDVARAISAAGGVDALLKLALNAPHEEIYAAASQALYALLKVSPHGRQRMTDDNLFRVLVRSLGDDTVPRRRHVMALCLREVVNAEPFTVASSSEAVLVLVRAFSLDANPDVQIAAAESLEMLLKTGNDQWRLFGRKRELAMGIVGVLEKAAGPQQQLVAIQNQPDSTTTQSDVCVAALRLLETAVRCEGCVAATEALFFVPFLKAFGDRHLARLHTAGGKVSALSARCLRLVVQYSPPASGLGVALVADHNALGSIVEGLLTAAQAPPPADANDAGQQSAAVLAKVLCVESAFCVALLLAQDPQCRDSFAQAIGESGALLQVRAAIVKGLNAAALEYYNETAILDVTGCVLNDSRSVTWEVAVLGGPPSSSGAQRRPTQQSIRIAFEDQEARLTSLIEMAETTIGGGAGSVPQQIAATSLQNLKSFYTELPKSVEQTARLTFIMLSYATFVTLRVDDGFETGEPGAAGAARNTFLSASQSSPRRTAGVPGVVQGILSSNYVAGSGPQGSLIAHAEQPGATRSSLLRTWSNNPRQREALEKAATAAAAGDTSLVANPKLSTYEEVLKRRGGADSPARLGGGGGSPPRQHPSSSMAAGARGGNSSISLGITQSPMKQYAFSKFDSALGLATSFAQFYNKNGDAAVEHGAAADSKLRTSSFELVDGFARRKATPSAGGKKAHYAAPTPNAKAWGIPQLKEGDLFYFSIPLSSISIASLEQVQSRAVRHLKSIKDQFTVTPHAARARRWFLFDMLNNIMPGIIACLSEMIALCDAHGEESVKFPLLLFAESQPVGHRSGALAGSHMVERGTLHSGNLIDATAQARFYFQSVTQQQNQQQARTMASPMAAALSAGEAASSTYLRDLERKIASLQEQRFSGHERTFPSISDDEDDEAMAAAASAAAGAAPATNAMDNLLRREDVVRSARPNRRRAMGTRNAIDRIGDDDD